jgi:hypothetical protein
MTGSIGTKKSSAGVSVINHSGSHMSTNFSRKKSKAGLSNPSAPNNGGTQGGTFATMNANSGLNNQQSKKNTI